MEENGCEQLLGDASQPWGDRAADTLKLEVDETGREKNLEL